MALKKGNADPKGAEIPLLHIRQLHTICDVMPFRIFFSKPALYSEYIERFIAVRDKIEFCGQKNHTAFYQMQQSYALQKHGTKHWYKHYLNRSSQSQMPLSYFLVSRKSVMHMHTAQIQKPKTSSDIKITNLSWELAQECCDHCAPEDVELWSISIPWYSCSLCSPRQNRLT